MTSAFSGTATTPDEASGVFIHYTCRFLPRHGENLKKYDFKIVHEATYPLTTKDFTSVIDAVAESKCDLLFLCSYLADSIGLARTIHAHRFCPKRVGGGMIGPQNTAVKTTLGPLLNGFVNYDYWQPVPKMRFPGVEQFLNTYQVRAGEAGVDLLGHYMAPLAYAQLQVVAQAVEATGGYSTTPALRHTHEARPLTPSWVRLLSA